MTSAEFHHGWNQQSAWKWEYYDGISPTYKSMRDRFPSLFKNGTSSLSFHRKTKLRCASISRRLLHSTNNSLCFVNIQNKKRWLKWCFNYINISDWQSRSARKLDTSSYFIAKGFLDRDLYFLSWRLMRQTIHLHSQMMRSRSAPSWMP